MAAGGVRAEPERGRGEEMERDGRDVRQGVAAGSRHEGLEGERTRGVRVNEFG
jgi:hypothetical protein